jgi:hypothetical protein
MNPNQLNERLAEAARYALLRRLAPAIRHDMAGALQPISMMASMLEKRMQKSAPDMAVLSGNSAAISVMSREAAATCIDLMTWLAPKEAKPIAVGEGVADCISLLNTDLSFRGFSLVDQTTGVKAEIARSTLRSVFMAALVALTDASDNPACLTLSASVDSAPDSAADAGPWLVLLLQIEKIEGEPSPDAPHAYRRLQWDDVEMLAQSEQVELSHTSSSAQLRCRMA